MPKKLTYNNVKNYIETDGTILKSERFVNVRTKLELECVNGHTYYMTLNNFQKGKRCKECHLSQIRRTYNEVKDLVETDGTKLISKTYKSTLIKLELECVNGHTYYMTLNKFMYGERCRICANNKRRNPFEMVISFIEANGTKLRSETYENATTTMEFECPNGHVYHTTFGNFQQGRRCKECPGGKPYSREEKKIYQFVKENYNGKVLPNDKSQIYNPLTGRYLELDIWLPESKKAIEYNSKYYHIGREYFDNLKIKECDRLGIDLLIIDHGQWIKHNDYEKIKEFIL